MGVLFTARLLTKPQGFRFLIVSDGIWLTTVMPQVGGL